jgi:hypothetical protein
MTNAPSPDGNRPEDSPPEPKVPLGGDRRSGNLKGVSTAVLSAFLNNPDALSPSVSGPVQESPKPRSVWPDIARDEVRSRRLKLDHLAMHTSARVSPPPPLSTDTGRLPRQQTGRFSAAGSQLAAAHLAHRRPQNPADPSSRRRLDQMVEQALELDGVLVLQRAIDVLEDRAIPERLSALGERVNELIPAPEEVKRLGAEVGKRLLVDNVDPVLALSVATKESAEHLERLKTWESLSAKERLMTTTGLTANLAEIVGVVSPPPINVGAQLASVGLQLMTLATEHSDSIEGVTQRVKTSEPTRRVMSELSGRGVVLAQRVEDAWSELSFRLARHRESKRWVAVLHQLREAFDSDLMRRLRRHPWSRASVLRLEHAVLVWLKRLRR